MFGKSKAAWNVSTMSMVAVCLLIAAGEVKADVVFGEPVTLGPAVNSAGAFFTTVSADGLELYFCSEQAGGYGDSDIWVSTRISRDDDWGEPTNLGPTINGPGWELSPCLSGDGLTLYFGSDRSGGQGGDDIWVTRRSTRADTWGPIENLGPPINTPGHEANVAVSSDGLQLFLSDWQPVRPGGYGGRDLWVSTRSAVTDPWGSPVRVNAPVNSPSNDEMHSLSSDGLILLLTSGSARGGYGSRDIWITRRITTSSPWSPPRNLGPTINTPDLDQSPTLSPDGSTLYFSSNRRGGFKIWQAPVLPVVDFTGDYRVDIEDLLLLIEHWGQNEPAYDMGPTPWGDGVIDRADLEVLMKYWGQETYDPYLLAHWKLDETEGEVAYDSAATNDAVIVGDALWQPAGGQIDGALQLDGIDDYIDTQFSLNPSDGSFRVFAWIKGAAPGRVILSQEGGANWLLVGSDGTLMTELSRSRGRQAGPLYSEATVTDGNWHRIGLVRSASQRTLYVDDMIVAQDDQDSLESASGSLFIGVGKDPFPDTSWSGLIDDVRIYDRVVVP